MEATDKIWMDGEFVDWKDANVHILTHALNYGGGVFEGIRVYATAEGQSVFRLREHMQRFLDSAKVIDLDVKYSLDELCDIVREAVRLNGEKVDYIKPLAYYGGEEVGLNPIKVPTRIAVSCIHMGSYLGVEQAEKGAKLVTSSWEKPSNRAASLQAKICGNYINSVLAKLEAVKRGADEALMLNSKGTVAEGSGENLFMIRHGRIYTPNLADGILEGITRNSVMEIALDQGYEVVEKEIARTELYVADEIFMTGTAAEVVPVVMIDDRVIGDGVPGRVTKDLQRRFSDAASGKDQRYRRWLDVV